MSKFSKFLVLLPALGFIGTVIFTLVVEKEIYTNYHWLLVTLLSFQIFDARFKNASSVAISIFLSGILANLLLLAAIEFDLKISQITLVLFVGYLILGFLIVLGNIVINRNKHFSANICRLLRRNNSKDGYV
jgi:hypothetical protein